MTAIPHSSLRSAQRANDNVGAGNDAADIGRFFELSLDLLAIASVADGSWKRVNPAMTRTLGWSEPELLRTPIAAIVHPDDLAHSQRGMDRLAAGESLTRFEHRLRCKNGAYRWIAWDTAVGHDGLLYCVGRDVTELRLTDEALRDSEERYRALMHASKTGYCVVEMKIEAGEPLDCCFIEVSQGFERLTKLDGVTGRWLRELRPDQDDSWFEMIRTVIETGRPLHFQHRARELDDCWFDIHAFPVGPPARRRIGILFNDITERRRTEEALASELEAMTRLHDLSRHVAQCRDFKSLLEAILDATITLHGADFGNLRLYEPADKTLRIMVQRGFDRGFLERFEVLHAGDASACGTAFAQNERVEIEDVETDLRGRHSRDLARAAGYRAVQSTPLYTSSGEPLGVLSTHFRQPRRLSEREHRLTDLYCRQASDAIATHILEASLRRSEERLRLAVDVGRLATWDWSLETGEIAWSDDHYLLQGYAVGEVKPSYEAWASRVHPADRAAAEVALVKARETRTDYTRVLRMLHPDGTVKWCSARGRYFYDPQGRPARMIGVMIDITARREWEERLQLLIAELQHRTRNLISVVRSIAHQTIAESDCTETFRRLFDDRLAALSRVQGLLARSDHRRIALEDLLRMEFEAFGIDAKCARVLMSGPKVVLPDAVVETLALALHELATNARKYGALAEQQGGTLSVTWQTHEDPGGQPRLTLEWLEQNEGTRWIPPQTAQRGFGRELIERALPYQLRAETRYEIGDTGVRCTIRLPITTDNTENRHAR